MTLTSTGYRLRFHSDKRIRPEDRIFKLKAKVWVYQGPAAWYLLTLPVTGAKAIKKRFGHMEKG